MTKIILIDDTTIHIEGYKNIITMESEQVCIQCQKKRLMIYGEKLKIETFSNVELNVYGLITKIEWMKI